ncbi:hypothetical protein [Citricoccus sp. GCM10030269]|uniref:hypothetical protein n=1 Tax=Citricoccus sp. GCM10030269 TaxID=3273388 RepID=UPI00360DF133
MSRQPLASLAITIPLAVAVLLGLAGCSGLPGSSGSSGATGSSASSAESGGMEASVSADASESADPSASAPSASDTAYESVDPERFQKGAGGPVAFASPTGNLNCAIHAERSAGFGYAAGCQAHSLVENLPDCDDPEANGPLVALQADGTVHTGCSREGIFFRQDPAVLQYGEQVQFQDVTCQSSEEGVTCTGLGTGFTASRSAFAPLG